MGGLFMNKEKREQIKIIEDALWCPAYVDKVVKSGDSFSHYIICNHQ